MILKLVSLERYLAQIDSWFEVVEKNMYDNEVVDTSKAIVFARLGRICQIFRQIGCDTKSKSNGQSFVQSIPFDLIKRLPWIQN